MTTPIQDTIDPRESAIASMATLIQLNETARTYLRERLQWGKFAKHTILLNAGQINDRLYFVHTGLARGYQVVGEEQITISFFKQSSIIYSPHSFFGQSTTRETVELLEGSTLVWLDYSDLPELYKYQPNAVDLGLRIANYYAAIFDEQLLAMRTLDGVQLYQWFLSRHPDLYGRIPHKKLASFLGMSHENLSRIQIGRLRAK